MSNKSANLLKAGFFILLMLALIAFRFSGAMPEGKSWFWIAIIISGILAIAFLRQAFQK